jgi:hypothetical protein
MDNDIIEPIYKILKEYEPNTTFEELIHECFNNFLQACKNDYEYYYSIENFEEMSSNNEYHYTENGKLI